MAIGNHVWEGSTVVDKDLYDEMAEALARLQREVLRAAEELPMSAMTRRHLRSLVFGSPKQREASHD